MSYRKLGIWMLARDLAHEIHPMTLNELLRFELYEGGSQIRRSVKSVKSNIVEGYGRRRYKHDVIRFLTYSLSSCDETIDHLETLYATESLTDPDIYRRLHEPTTSDASSPSSFKVLKQVTAPNIEHRLAKTCAHGALLLRRKMLKFAILV